MLCFSNTFTDINLFASLFTNYFQKYHDILQGNIIHVKRADMQSIDGFLHVPDPLFYTDAIKGLAVFFNPTLDHLQSYVNLPLYYTGLEDNATLVREESTEVPVTHQLKRDFSIDILIGMIFISQTQCYKSQILRPL